jgi:hypothetical protein
MKPVLPLNQRQWLWAIIALVHNGGNPSVVVGQAPAECCPEPCPEPVEGLVEG